MTNYERAVDKVKELQEKYKFTCWTHRKGGRYFVLEVVLIEDSLEPGIVYSHIDEHDIVDDLRWMRPESNFFDGRFKQNE